MKYLCNPININYRYQFNAASRPGGKLQICREAADPSMICFHDRYYISGQSHLKLNYNVRYGNKNYHTAKRKGGDRNRIKANEVKDNEEGKRALVGQTDRTGRR